MFSNQRRNLNNRSVARKDKLNREMRIYSFPRERLSSYVDLRDSMTPIEHQGNMSTWEMNRVLKFIYLFKVVQMHLLVFVTELKPDRTGSDYQPVGKKPEIHRLKLLKNLLF
jgi:hypothetical protein